MALGDALMKSGVVAPTSGSLNPAVVKFELIEGVSGMSDTTDVAPQLRKALEGSLSALRRLSDKKVCRVSVSHNGNRPMKSLKED